MGEDIAVGHLQGLGYTLLSRNYHCRYGELDAVFQDGETIVICEVKTRRSRSFGLPEESVTHAKRAKIVRAAETYLAATGRAQAPWRLDLIAIELKSTGVTRVDHYQNIEA